VFKIKVATLPLLRFKFRFVWRD